jgi:hypothetical protein
MQFRPDGSAQVFGASADEEFVIKRFSQADDTVSPGQVCCPRLTNQSIYLSFNQISCDRFTRPSFGHNCANATRRRLGLLVQCEMRSPSDDTRSHDCIKVCAQGQFVHVARQVALKPKCSRLNSQAFATFGATSIDNSASSAGFHAHQKAMGASATCFRRLVCAFHVN